MKKKATVEDIKNLVKILSKNKVEPPYYIQVENPIERGDFISDSVSTEWETEKRGK